MTVGWGGISAQKKRRGGCSPCIPTEGLGQPGLLPGCHNRGPGDPWGPSWAAHWSAPDRVWMAGAGEAQEEVELCGDGRRRPRAALRSRGRGGQGHTGPNSRSAVPCSYWAGSSAPGSEEGTLPTVTVEHQGGTVAGCSPTQTCAQIIPSATPRYSWGPEPRAGNTLK